jgi:hypothetical protein
MEMTGLWKAWKAKDASPSFHEPLGNLAKDGRDSHIPTAPATKADGKVENQKQVFHFSTAPNIFPPNKQEKPPREGLRPAAGASRRLRVKE